MKQIFSDLVVIELASVLAGPAVGMFFAELGATVIKVENPATGGDVTRQWRLADEPETDRTAYFCSVNWGKKSVAVDLASKDGMQIVYELVAKADVVISSYKKGSAEKLGMSYADFKQVNPDIIHGRIIGYSPEDERVAFDAILQAACGFTYMNGEKGGEPVKMPVALMDLLTAHQLKEGLLLALLKRAQGGGGSLITASLFQAGIASLANQATNWLQAGYIPQRIGSDHPNIVPYGTIFTTQDEKQLVIAVGNNRQFAALCGLLDASELADNPRFAENPSRVKHRDELLELMRERFKTLPADILLKGMKELGIPGELVRDMQQVFQQDLAEEMVLRADSVAGVRSIAFASGLAEPVELNPPPKFGEHTEEILTVWKK